MRHCSPCKCCQAEHQRVKRVKRQLERSQSDSLKWATVVVCALAIWTLLLFVLPYSAWLSLGLKVLVFGLPAYVAAKSTAAGDGVVGALGLKRPPHPGWIAASTVVLAAYLALLGGWSGLRPVSAFFVVSAVVISPFVEEFAFRGGAPAAA